MFCQTSAEVSYRCGVDRRLRVVRPLLVGQCTKKTLRCEQHRLAYRFREGDSEMPSMSAREERRFDVDYAKHVSCAGKRGQGRYPSRKQGQARGCLDLLLSSLEVLPKPGQRRCQRETWA